MQASNWAVSDLFDYVYGVWGNDISPQGYVERAHYVGGRQYSCPVLDAMEPDSNFTLLVRALNESPNAPPLSLQPRKVLLAPAQLIEKYCIPRVEFSCKQIEEEHGQGSTPPSTVTLEAISVDAPIQNIFCEAVFPSIIDVNKEIYLTISFTCAHWITATKIHVLLCSLFSLSCEESSYVQNTLTLRPKDKEQFIDMMLFITRQHTVSKEARLPFHKLINNLMWTSENNRNHRLVAKGLQTLLKV